MTVMPSQEFESNVALAKRESVEHPVYIMDDGQPTHVLLSIEEYRRLGGKGPSLADVLYMPGAEDVDLDSVLPQRTARPRTVELD